MTPLIELRDASKSFPVGTMGRQRKVALDRFSFALDPDRPGSLR